MSLLQTHWCNYCEREFTPNDVSAPQCDTCYGVSVVFEKTKSVWLTPNKTMATPASLEDLTFCSICEALVKDRRNAHSKHRTHTGQEAARRAFTPQEVENLKRYQRLSTVYPLTCSEVHGPLEPTEDGLVCHTCGYTQTQLSDGFLQSIKAIDVNWMRKENWAVAVHNDYRLHGVPHTFWLFTRDSECVSGEGTTDEEAFLQIQGKLEDRERFPPHRTITELNERYRTLQQLCEAMQEADHKAIKMWQAAHPGNDSLWPDRTDVVQWLLEKNEDLQAQLNHALEDVCNATKATTVLS